MAPFNSPYSKNYRHRCYSPKRFTFSFEDIFKSNLNLNTNYSIPHWTSFPKSKTKILSRMELTIKIYRRYYYVKWIKSI